MKRAIILFFTVVVAFSAYSQNPLQDGDHCFENSDYACAETKYNEAFKSASGRDKQLAEIKLSRAKNCAEWTKIANQAFNNRNYTVAKENYQYILDSNPNDASAKARLNECDKLLTPVTLVVSKTYLAFTSSGGNENVTVTTNADSYTVSGLPSWCSIQKQADFFVITCSSNSATSTRTGNLTVTAGDKTVRIEISQSGTTPRSPATTLSVSKQNIAFNSSGGNETITIRTNANSFSISSLPSWCRVQKNTDNFVLVCSANTGNTTRNGNFTVSAGDKTVKIDVTQSGNTNQPATSLKISNQNLSFRSSGGKSEQISVYSNAGTYSVSEVPTWCSVQLFDGYFVVTCYTNNSNRSRQSWFAIKSGGIEQRVYVNQEGSIMSNRNAQPVSTRNSVGYHRRVSCFNCPKANYPWGLTAGYVSKKIDFNSANYYSYNKMNGIQIGLRFEPLFKYGFGLNTGLFYEYYFDDYDKDFSFNVLNIPLHLEYRFNISKYFNIFFYGGIGLDFLTDSSFEDFSTNTLFEYGGGVRIDHIQFNIGQSMKLKNFQTIPYDERNNKNLVISMSYMF